MATLSLRDTEELNSAPDKFFEKATTTSTEPLLQRLHSGQNAPQQAYSEGAP